MQDKHIYAREQTNEDSEQRKSPGVFKKLKGD